MSFGRYPCAIGFFFPPQHSAQHLSLAHEARNRNRTFLADASSVVMMYNCEPRYSVGLTLPKKGMRRILFAKHVYTLLKTPCLWKFNNKPKFDGTPTFKLLWICTISCAFCLTTGVCVCAGQATT